jgi:hypothetical protein
MLSPLWWLPLVLAAAAPYPIWRGARRLQAEAAGLQKSIAELRLVRPLVGEVTAELAAVARAARERRGLAGRGIDDMGHR